MLDGIIRGYWRVIALSIAFGCATSTLHSDETVKGYDKLMSRLKQHQHIDPSGLVDWTAGTALALNKFRPSMPRLSAKELKGFSLQYLKIASHLEAALSKTASDDGLVYSLNVTSENERELSETEYHAYRKALRELKNPNSDNPVMVTVSLQRNDLLEASYKFYRAAPTSLLNQVLESHCQAIVPDDHVHRQKLLKDLVGGTLPVERSDYWRAFFKYQNCQFSVNRYLKQLKSSQLTLDNTLRRLKSTLSEYQFDSKYKDIEERHGRMWQSVATELITYGNAAKEEKVRVKLKEAFRSGSRQAKEALEKRRVSGKVDLDQEILVTHTKEFQISEIIGILSYAPLTGNLNPMIASMAAQCSDNLKNQNEYLALLSKRRYAPEKLRGLLLRWAVAQGENFNFLDKLATLYSGDEVVGTQIYSLLSKNTNPNISHWRQALMAKLDVRLPDEVLLKRLNAAVSELQNELPIDQYKVRREGSRSVPFWQGVIPYQNTLDVLSAGHQFAGKLNDFHVKDIVKVISKGDRLRAALAMWLLLNHGDDKIISETIQANNEHLHRHFLSADYTLEENALKSPVAGVQDLLFLALCRGLAFTSESQRREYDAYRKNIFQSPRHATRYRKIFNKDYKYYVMKKLLSKYSDVDTLRQEQPRTYLHSSKGFYIYTHLLWEGYLRSKIGITESSRKALTTEGETRVVKILELTNWYPTEDLWRASVGEAFSHADANQSYRHKFIYKLFLSRYHLKAILKEKHSLLLKWLESEKDWNYMYFLVQMMRDSGTLMKSKSQIRKKLSSEEFVIYDDKRLTNAFLLLGADFEHPSHSQIYKSEEKLLHWILDICLQGRSDIAFTEKLWSQILDSRSSILIAKAILQNSERFKPYRAKMLSPKVWAGRYNFNLRRPSQDKDNAIVSLLTLQYLLADLWK